MHPLIQHIQRYLSIGTFFQSPNTDIYIDKHTISKLLHENIAVSATVKAQRDLFKDVWKTSGSDQLPQLKSNSYFCGHNYIAFHLCIFCKHRCHANTVI